MLERLARWIGWTTLYHVAWTQPVVIGGYRSGDMLITASPWITSANWKKVREVIATDNALEAGNFTITSVTRLYAGLRIGVKDENH